MNFVIVTGMSGAGKTSVGNILEDLGYNCIDNLPISLIPQFITLYKNQDGKNQNIALIIDIRGGDNVDEVLTISERLKNEDDSCKIIFLDSSDEVIIRRYKESRHTHPLVMSKKVSLEKALIEERSKLERVREHSDLVLDTTFIRINVCREQIISFLGNTAPHIMVTCLSFGFKYGLPSDTDLVFDVRCFPNPFYVDELKEHTGLEECVKNYVMSHASTRVFIDKLEDMMKYLIPLYVEDGRSHLTIAVGCTGGKHRSVAIAEELAARLSKTGSVNSVTVHRDISK